MASYIIQKGDSFYGIAKKLGIDANELARLNGLNLNSVIHPGQKLTYSLGRADIGPQPYNNTSVISLPAPKANYQPVNYALQNTYTEKYQPGMYLYKPSPTIGFVEPVSPIPQIKMPQTYTIQKGDNLTSIAKKHGMDLNALIDLNGITSKTILHEGDVIAVDANFTRMPKQLKNNNLVSNSTGGGSFGGGSTGGGGASGGWDAAPPGWAEKEITENGFTVIQTSFKDAFAAARKRGDKTFVWNGKTYGTQLATKNLAAKLKGKGEKKGIVIIPEEQWHGIKVYKQ